MARTLTSRRQPLSPERICDAAIELIDRDGLEALSMRHLGSALGVEAMSLYRHFPSKNALLEAVVGRLLAELLLPVPGSAPWQDSFRAPARGYPSPRLRHPQPVPPPPPLHPSNPDGVTATGPVKRSHHRSG